MKATALLLTGLAALVCAGCAAPPTQVILLPQPGGAGAVEVSTAAGSQRIDRGYAEATVQASGAITAQQLDAAQVNTRYAPLLAVQPAPAQDFTLYFDTGGVVLTPQSEAALKTLLALARERPGGEIVVIGHTDRVGSVQSNDALSLQRARAVRETIIADGFDPNRITAAGRGERDPAVPTDDEVAEPRNRRADIVVR